MLDYFPTDFKFQVKKKSWKGLKSNEKLRRILKLLNVVNRAFYMIISAEMGREIFQENYIWYLLYSKKGCTRYLNWFCLFFNWRVRSFLSKGLIQILNTLPTFQSQECRSSRRCSNLFKLYIFFKSITL